MPSSVAIIFFVFLQLATSPQAHSAQGKARPSASIQGTLFPHHQVRFGIKDVGAAAASIATAPKPQSKTPPKPKQKKLSVGWDCHVTRRHHCSFCLSGRTSRVCEGILLFGRSNMKNVQHFRDDLPFLAEDYEAFAARFVAPEHVIRCAGFASLLLRDVACTFPELTIPALEAEAFASAASRDFAVKGSLFSPVKDPVTGVWEVEWTPPGDKIRGPPKPGIPTTASFSGRQVFGLWQALFKRLSRARCVKRRVVTRKVRGRWHTSVRC